MNLYRNNLTIGDIPQLDVVVNNFPKDGLVAYYKLDETSGTTAIDYVNSYNGTISGVTINQTGKIEKSYSFTSNNNFSTNFVNIGSQLDTIGTSSFSLSFWVKTTSSGVGGRIISKDQDSSTTGNWAVGFNITGKIDFFYRGASAVIITGTKTINNGNWHHVVVTRDTTNGTRKIYIDNVLDVQISSGDTKTGTGLSPFTFGSEYSTSSEYPDGFIGYLDEVAVYSKSLTTTEISQLYNSGNAIIYN